MKERRATVSEGLIPRALKPVEVFVAPSRSFLREPKPIGDSKRGAVHHGPDAFTVYTTID